MLGMRFHRDKSGQWLPIVVQGDPNSPRAQPSFSVADIKAGHSRAKKDTLVGAGLSILKPQHTAGLEAGKVGGISSTSQLPDTAHVSAQEEFKLPGDNLDNAEDDSQIAQHENGPEGKEEIQDDDQNPDGQVRLEH